MKKTKVEELLYFLGEEYPKYILDVMETAVQIAYTAKGITEEQRNAIRSIIKNPQLSIQKKEEKVVEYLEGLNGASVEGGDMVSYLEYLANHDEKGNLSPHLKRPVYAMKITKWEKTTKEKMIKEKMDRIRQLTDFIQIFNPEEEIEPEKVYKKVKGKHLELDKIEEEY